MCHYPVYSEPEPDHHKIKSTGSKVLIMTILPPYEPYLLTRHPAAFYQPEGVARAVNN